MMFCISGSPRRVFVSYSRSDFYFAEQLAVALRRRGLDVWFDVHELAPGTDWSEAIDRAIEACDVFVLVASRAALESPYVQRERDFAARVGRPQVAVRAGRVPGLGSLPTYDLRSSFERGGGRLASDLAAGTPTDWRPRVRLPCSAGVAVYALAPALSILFAVVLLALFLHRVIGHESPAATHVGVRLGLVGSSVAIAGLFPAWLLWAFLRRRLGWLYLRGSLVTMPLVAVLGVVTVEQMAAALLPLGAAASALGVSPEPIQLFAAEALAVLLIPVCLAVGVVTELSSGLCRFLRTGAAPRRIRLRHVGNVSRPDRDGAVRAYRLFAADDDAGVAEEVRRSLADVGIEEAADGERDVVVLTDRTPVEWLARADLRDPLAVVATSIALPVRGVLERFQWIDYRRRRRGTLEMLGRNLATETGSDADARAVPEVPERLQHLRLPVAIVIVEWTLYSMAVLAADVAGYGLALAAFHSRNELVWPAAVCLGLAPVPFVLARRLRRRRLTPHLLVGVMAVYWAALIGLGLDRVLQVMYPSWDRGSFSAASPIYVAISVVVVALAWSSLRRWLPRRIRSGRSVRPSLGYARGSLLWVTMLVPALVGSVGIAVLAAPPTPIELAADDVCRDRAGLEALSMPVYAADQARHRAILRGTREQAIAAFERRTRVATGAVHALERYQAHSSWGAAIKKRLIAALVRTVQADHAYLAREIDGKTWVSERLQLNPVADDVAKPIC
jgi:TIR domain